MLVKMLANNWETGKPLMSDYEIEVEVTGFTFTAVGTSGTAMTYLMYELSCHPEWQDKLRDELTKAGALVNPFSNDRLKDLPILGACIHETSDCIRQLSLACHLLVLYMARLLVGFPSLEVQGRFRACIVTSHNHCRSKSARGHLQHSEIPKYSRIQVNSIQQDGLGWSMEIRT